MFVISIVVARILVPSDYGVMGVAMMLIGFANLLTDFGFSPAVVQRQIRDKDTLQSIFTFNLAASTALALLFGLSARFIAAFFRSAECENVVIVMSSVFVITSFSAVPRAILRRDLDFKTLSVVDAASAVSMSLLTLVLALARFRYWALALGQLIPMVVSTAVLCVRQRWVPLVLYRHAAMKRILPFGFWNVFKTQLEFAVAHVDKVILGRLAGLTALGYYDKAVSLATIPHDSLVSSLNAVLFTSFSQRQRDRRELQDLFGKALTTETALAFPIYTGLCVVAPYFVLSLLGQKWAPMVVPLQIIAVSFSVRAIGSLVVAVNVAVGKYRAYTLRYLGAGCVFVVLCALLAGRGPTGVALAFLLFSVLFVALGLHVAVSAVDLSWADVIHACWPAAKATACMAALTELLAFLLPARTFLHLAAISATGALIYVLCLALDTNASLVALRQALIADALRLARSCLSSGKKSLTS